MAQIKTEVPQESKAVVSEQEVTIAKAEQLNEDQEEEKKTDNETAEVPVYTVECNVKKLKPTIFKSLSGDQMICSVVQRNEKVFGSDFEVYGADEGFALKSFPFRGISNHFIRCLHAAFMHHLPLQLRADDLWIIIAQGIATHIFKNAEKLREKFVDFEGKKEIVVEDNSLRIGSETNDWSNVLHQFDDGCRALTNNDIVDLMTCDFTTTTTATRTASKCVLFKAMSEYISFRTMTRSGIPSVSLVGTVADWQRVLTKCEAVKEMQIGLDWWLEEVIAVVANIVETVKLRADDAKKALNEDLQQFWESVYHFQSMSGGEAISGWCKTLFPYVKEDQQRNNELKWQKGGWPHLSPGDFPATYCRAPMTWDYMGKQIKCGMYGGIFGVAQQAKTGCVAPVIGWAIAGK